MGAPLPQSDYWTAMPGGGPSLFWNPGAISYLMELLLSLVLTVYFAIRVARDIRSRRVHVPTLLLTIAIGALVPTFWASLIRVLTAGGWISYAMPWSPLASWNTLSMPWARPFGALSATAFVMVGYYFPKPLRGTMRERRAFAAILIVLTLAEVGIAVRTDIAIMRGEAWWRPEWIAGWMNVATIWGTIVFWRQLASAQRDGGTRKPPGMTSACFRGLAAIVQRPANRDATAARGFLIFSILPIIHTAALFMPNEGQFGRYPLDIFICWSVLIQLVGFAIVMLGYLPERSSFQFKLTVVSLAVMLGSINGVAWMMAPAYEAEFRAPGMAETGRAVNFLPLDDGRYLVQPLPSMTASRRGYEIAPQGQRIELPFRFDFYGKQYRSLFVGSRGVIGFDRMPRPSDAAFGIGTQPAIYPLLVDVPETGTRLSVLVDKGRVVISRIDQCAQNGADTCYHVQTTLHASGNIDIHYLRVPPVPEFSLFSPTKAPWQTGITPGTIRVASEADTPFIRDHYRAFLAYLDRLYAPLVLFSIIVTIALLVVIPLFLRGFLMRPLDQLLQGIRQFRGGLLETEVEVSFHDEIGYLTESFNEMARDQHAILRDLEHRVAERVSEIEAMTVHNAQLEERHRLSADLHDAVAQTLASASMLANAMSGQFREDGRGNVATAERVARLNRHALIEMQTLLGELRGTVGSDRSLPDRLGDLARYFADLHGLKIESELNGETPLPAEVRAVFYRIAQEGLNNIVKHSGASAATLMFECVPNHALLVISDNGRGCAPEGIDKPDRLGMTIMRDRARQIDATLELDTDVGKGCRITLNWGGSSDQY